MRWVLIGFAVLAAIVLVAVVAGSMRPRARAARRSRRIPSPPFRLAARLVFGWQGMLDRDLVSPGRRFGQAVSPAPAGG